MSLRPGNPETSFQKLYRPVFIWAARKYKVVVGKELRKYGLRYDDLLDPTMDLDVAESLKRMPQKILDERNQRLKRAMDLSMKHTYLSPEMQAKQTPFKFYLQGTLKDVQRENAERAMLGGVAKYQRQIP